MNSDLSVVPSTGAEKMNALAFPLSPATMQQYIHAVNSYPTLSVEQERELLLSFKKTKEWKIAEKIILANLKFVVFIAKTFSGYQLSQADLIQEGNIGLIKALKHYDPAFKVRLMAFAIHWIKSEIYEFILNNWKIVKIANNKHQRKLFFNLRKFFQKDLESPPSLEKIAQELNVPLHEAEKMQARLFSGTDLSFETLSQSQSNESESGYSTQTQQLALTDRNSDFSLQLAHTQEKEEWLQRIHFTLQQLDARSRDILYSRWLKEPKETLEEISKRYHISFERVRQLEKKALEQFKKMMLGKLGQTPLLPKRSGLNLLEDQR